MEILKMKTLVAVTIALLALSSSLWADQINKEGCGLDANKKQFSFSHQGSFMDDKAYLEFTGNGGFKLYDENGTNHIWEVDAEGFQLVYRELTWGSRSNFRSHSLDASPRQVSGSGTVQTTDWTDDFVLLLHTITHMEITLGQTAEPQEQVEAALYCAQKILMNAAARGQENHLKGKLNVKF
jgi:hypothetical protein